MIGVRTPPGAGSAPCGSHTVKKHAESGHRVPGLDRRRWRRPRLLAAAASASDERTGGDDPGGGATRFLATGFQRGASRNCQMARHTTCSRVANCVAI